MIISSDSSGTISTVVLLLSRPNALTSDNTETLDDVVNFMMNWSNGREIKIVILDAVDQDEPEITWDMVFLQGSIMADQIEFVVV